MKYVFPSSSLLKYNSNHNDSKNVSNEPIESKIRECLRAHKIDVELQGIHYSPTNIVIDYELKLLYEKSILDAVSGTKYISVLSIQKMLDISFAEATRVMRYLEKNMLVSKNVFLKGRPVIQDNIDIRLKNIEETISM